MVLLFASSHCLARRRVSCVFVPCAVLCASDVAFLRIALQMNSFCGAFM